MAKELYVRQRTSGVKNGITYHVTKTIDTTEWGIDDMLTKEKIEELIKNGTIKVTIEGSIKGSMIWINWATKD